MIQQDAHLRRYNGEEQDSQVRLQCIVLTVVAMGVCFVRLRGKAHRDFVQCVCWNPVSHELASCSWDGTLLCRAVDSVTDGHVDMNDH